ncbi:putative Snare region anchored in the vesicle membrane C-terminus [Leishmania utingensis]|uniref:Snare region anchored in the vesicle membrane C-terminus n=1 Tax=Leishmania utingensis TaxID=653362 RepID=A0AAW2ZXL1_9TRYP
MDPEARQAATWERLRNEARQTDQLIDQQLRKLEVVALFDDEKIIGSAAASPFTNNDPDTSCSATPAVPVLSSSALHSGGFSPPPASTMLFEDVESQYRGAERDIDESLRRLEQTVLSMEDACRELGPTSTAARHTERFRGVLAEKQQTRRRLTAEFRQRKDRYELAASWRAGDTRRRISPGDDAASGGVRILIDEQASIQHTLSRVKGLLEQAEDTRDRLRTQRERFNEIGDKLLHIAERIPFVQNILHHIDVRKRREMVVLGTVMSSLMFVFVFFL